MIQNKQSLHLTIVVIYRAVDPDSFNSDPDTDPDPAFHANSDQDTDPDPGF